jgi:hypothetical protein
MEIPMKIRVSMVALVLTSALLSPALAVNPHFSRSTASPVVTIQDEENQELWRDLETGQTPPKAAVGNEDQTPRSWEKAMNQMDCEKARGLWDAPTNKCLEKK